MSAEPLRQVRDALVRWVATYPATVRRKLMFAFLLIAGLLVSVAGVALQGLHAQESQAQELAQLQRRIAAYRQLSFDVLAQLHSVSNALLDVSERRHEDALRQLKQFSYDLDRVRHVDASDATSLERVRSALAAFVQSAESTVSSLREGRREQGIREQLTVATPLGDRVERLLSEMVNRAEADLVDGLQKSRETSARVWTTIVACSLVAIGLALGLGYIISLAIIRPVAVIGERVQAIGLGQFTGAVDVPSGDELGTLAAGVNGMSAKLTELYGQVEAARASAARANDEKSLFITAACHDLRQPAVAAMLWHRMLKEAQETGDARRLDRAHWGLEGTLRALNQLFGEILDVGRLELGRGVVQREPVDLGSFLQTVHDEYGAAAQHREVRFSLRLPKRCMPVADSDSTLLGRIVRNLLTNAFSYTPKGRVLLAAAMIGNEIKIVVADSGEGLSDEIQEWMRQPLDPGKPVLKLAGPGRHLGLVIVRKMVGLLGDHSLRIATRAGAGTRFTVVVPRAVECVAADADTPHNDRQDFDFAEDGRAGAHARPS